MARCNCKVGRCAECDSDCKRCCCACDGVAPEVALARKNGQRGKRKRNHEAAGSAGPARKSRAQGARVMVEQLALLGPGDAAKEFEVPDDGISVSKIWRFFGFSETTKKKLPSEKARKDGSVESPGPGWSCLVQSVLATAVAVAECLYPGNVQRLLRDVAFKIIGHDRPEQELNKAAEVIAEALLNAPNASIQKRVVRACFTKAFSRAMIARACAKKGLKWTTGHERQGYMDYKTLVSGVTIEKVVKRAARYDEDAVRRTVKFILQAKMVGAMSWGTRSVRLGNEVVELPCLVRRMSTKEMYEEYCATFEAEQRVSRGSFYEVVKRITFADEKLLTAVDYVTGVLVHDTSTILQDMVDTFASSPERKEKLSHYLELTRHFLKKQYSSHVVKTGDDVPTHDVSYALGKDGDGETRSGKCNACDFVPFFIDELRSEIRASGAGPSPRKSADVVSDANRVLSDIALKFELYQGHRARVANQQGAISKLHRELEKECARKGETTRAIMTIDWKMKFEATSARETTQQHFGKRGMSWHGCLVTYFRPVVVETVKEDGTTVEETKAERINVYIDQIMDGDNRQDAAAVASMVEAALEHVKAQLPQIKSVILQSDNAKCYQSNALRMLVQLINTRSPLKVERHIFTETQDGKGLIDAHFARCTAHILRFMRHSQRNRIRAIATPKGLAFALAWKGGITNSSVQFVRIDRAKMSVLVNEYIKMPVEKLATKFFTRCNDVFFLSDSGGGNETAIVTAADLKHAKESGRTFRFRATAYSGIDQGNTFSFVPGGDVELLDEASQLVQPMAARGEDNGEESAENDRQQDETETCVDAAMALAGLSSDEPDFVLNEEEAATAEAVVIVDQDEQGEASDDEDDDSQGEEEDTTVPNVDYAPATINSDLVLTGVQVLKASGFGVIVGPRDAGRKKRNRVHARESPRKDLVAFAVRSASSLIDHHDVDIRDGQMEMPEYANAANLATKPRPRGWGRRPPHGHQFGASYMAAYVKDIKEMFGRGATESSAKMGPAQMHEALKEMYPDRFSLPTENQIRSEISKIFANAKKEGTTNGNSTSSTGAPKKRGRQSKLPPDLLDFIDVLVDNEPTIKPSEVLVHVKAKFGESITATDGTKVDPKQIKSRVSNSKVQKKPKFNL